MGRTSPMNSWRWENGSGRTAESESSPGEDNDPIYKSVFAVNLGAVDLYGLEHIPQTDNHTILLGTTDEFRGRGAGKINADGAEQARRGGHKIVSTVRDNGEVSSADAILVTATTAGGTGSGSVGVIVDMLKEAFKKPVYAMLVLPFMNQYDDPDSMFNTATCLKKVLENSSADAVFLVDNQKFVQGNQSMTYNYSQINRKIADSFMDILCVGEETDRRYIGEVLDANDVIRILKGPTAIGVSSAAIPKKTGGFMARLRGDKYKSNHFSVDKTQMERAQNVLHQALGDLSLDCESWDSGTPILRRPQCPRSVQRPPGRSHRRDRGNDGQQPLGVGPRRGPPQGHVSRPRIRHHQLYRDYLQYRRGRGDGQGGVLLHRSHQIDVRSPDQAGRTREAVAGSQSSSGPFAGSLGPDSFVERVRSTYMTCDNRRKL